MAAPVTTTAEVTFYGHDQTDDVTVAGRIEGRPPTGRSVKRGGSRGRCRRRAMGFGVQRPFMAQLIGGVEWTRQDWPRADVSIYGTTNFEDSDRVGARPRCSRELYGAQSRSAAVADRAVDTGTAIVIRWS